MTRPERSAEDRLDELKTLATEMADLLELHEEWSRVGSVLERWRDFSAREDALDA